MTSRGVGVFSPLMIDQWRMTIGSELAQRLMRPRKVSWTKHERETLYVEFDPQSLEPLGVSGALDNLKKGAAALKVDADLVKGAPIRLNIASKVIGDVPTSIHIQDLTKEVAQSGPIIREAAAEPVDDFENDRYVTYVMKELPWGSLSMWTRRIRNGRTINWFGLAPQSALAQWLFEKSGGSLGVEQFREKIVEIMKGGDPRHAIYIGEGGRFIGSEMICADGSTYEYGLTLGTKIYVAFERRKRGEEREFIPVGYSAAGFKGSIPEAFLRWYDNPRYREKRSQMLTSLRLLEMIAKGNVTAELRVRHLASYLTEGDTSLFQRVATLHHEVAGEEEAARTEIWRLTSEYIGSRFSPGMKSSDMMLKDLRSYSRGDSFTVQQIVAMAYVEMLMRKTMGDKAVTKIIDECKPSTDLTASWIEDGSKDVESWKPRIIS